MKTTIQMLIVALLILFGSSCNHSKIKNQEVCDVYIKPEEHFCRCRWVRVKDFKAITDPIDYDLDHCHGFSGVRTTQLAREIIPKVKLEIRRCEDLEFENDY